MMAMLEVAVSSGAACTSAQPEPSHVLRAIGLDEALARASQFRWRAFVSHTKQCKRPEAGRTLLF